MSRRGKYGDHITLQAIANAFGVHVMLVTSYVETPVIELSPLKLRSKLYLWMSYWEQLHYASLYPKGEAPSMFAPCIIA